MPPPSSTPASQPVRVPSAARRATRGLRHAAWLLCGLLAAGSDGHAQAGRAVPLTIPYLANDTTPEALDFAAAQCEQAPAGDRLRCTIRQLFVTVASHDPTACVATTNGYELEFRKAAPNRWVSVGEPEGPCGVTETTTLEDGGGTRWTMTISRAVTGDSSRSECRAAAGTDTYGWRHVKRPLPCRTLQPGAIER